MKATIRMTRPAAFAITLLGIVTLVTARAQAPASTGGPGGGQASASTTAEGCAAPRARRAPPAGAAGAPAAAALPGYPPPGAEDQRPGPPRKHLLIWADTKNGIGQHDSIAHAEAVIEELGYKSGIYDSYIRTDSAIISRNPKQTNGDPASGGPNLCNVDAIFFLGHREIDIDEQQKADLLWFVHDAGKGFVAAHTGTTAFFSWPEFGEMLGARFDNHPWGIVTAPVIVVDPKFPGMKQFGPVFDFHEEFYQSKGFSPEKSRLLMRLDTSKLDMTKPQVQAADAPYALTWAKMYGKGRVFYSAFGHAPSTWDDPRVQEMYLDAIKWSMGLIEGDATPVPLTVSPTGK